MDTFINVSLVLFASIGTVVAIGGRTWDASQAVLLKKFTKLGWLALLCVLMSMVLGTTKEIRHARTLGENQAKLDTLETTNTTLLNNNDDLRESISNLSTFVVRSERIERLSFHVDAFDGDEGRGFNTLERLMERISPSQPDDDRPIGIFLSLTYGSLTVHLFGYSKDDDEKWYCKLRFNSENVDRENFFETEPLVLTNDGSYLIDGTLGERELDQFWLSKPRVADVVSRQESSEEMFRPRAEIGMLAVEAFGFLVEDAVAGEFARHKSGNWFEDEIQIPSRFLKQWHIELEINGRRINQIEQVVNGVTFNIHTQRLLKWPIQDEFRSKHNEALIAPVDRAWIH